MAHLYILQLMTMQCPDPGNYYLLSERTGLKCIARDRKLRNSEKENRVDAGFEFFGNDSLRITKTILPARRNIPARQFFFGVQRQRDHPEIAPARFAADK